MTATRAPWAWRETRLRPAEPLRSAFVPAALTAVPIIVQLHRLYADGRTELAVAIGILVAAALVRRVPQLLPVVPVAAFAGVATVVRLEARVSLGVVAAVSIVIWSLVVGAVRPRWPSLAPRARFVPAAAPLVVGSVLLMLVPGTRLPVLAALLSAVLAIGSVLAGRRIDVVVEAVARWSSSSPAVRMDRVRASVAERFGRVVAGAAMLLPAAVVLLSWAMQRLVRFDPMSPPARVGSRWVERPSGSAFPERLYTPAAVVDPRGLPRRAHQALAGALVLALVAAPPLRFLYGRGYRVSLAEGVYVVSPDEVASLVEDQDCTEVPLGTDPDPVMGQDPGWPRVACEVSRFVTAGQFDATTSYRFPDHRGEMVNVVDGERRTWRPPECECTRLTVWWFGGSAAWGYWQRDEFSLPSQLAKAAWERGVALDVHNFAMPGWVIGQESRRFAQLVAESPEPPDLVVFYDGGNELNRQKDRNDDGRGSDESETSFAEAQLDDVLHNGPFPFGEEHVPRDSSWPADDERLPPATLARHALARYERGVRLARFTADAAGVEPVFLWQPLLPSSSAAAGDPEVMSPEDRVAWAEMLPVAFDLLPEGVIDLHDSLDGVERPVFKDVWHTNELGADVVAREIDRRLAATYDAAARRQAGGAGSGDR